MSTEDNKALVHKWIDAMFHTRDLSEQSPIYQLFATDFVAHFTSRPRIEGLEAFRQFGSLYVSAFPDVQITVEDLIAEGDKVVMRYSWRGTHQGELLGIPATGKQVVGSGINILRVANGKIAEQWGSPDDLGLLQQLGVVPQIG
jgi:steroid delta-isomerase-like uncharacterized protein